MTNDKTQNEFEQDLHWEKRIIFSAEIEMNFLCSVVDNKRVFSYLHDYIQHSLHVHKNGFS